MRTTMGDKLKALIVDDEIDVCYLLTAILNCKNLIFDGTVPAA